MNLYNKILATIFIIVSFFLIGLSIKNIHSISSVVTDDNIYQDLPNKIFVNAPIKARKKLGIENNKEQFEDMSIKRGSILLAIDNKKIYSLDSVFLYIKNSDKKVHNLDFFVIKNDEKSIGKRYSFEVKKSDIFDSSFINLESAVIISYVLDAGTSYNAGLKVGDIITKVNGQNFKSAFDAFKMTNLQSNGRSVRFMIYRNGMFSNVNVQLKVIKLTFSILLTFLIGIVLILMAMFIAMKRFYLFQGKIVSLTLLTLGTYITFLPSSTLMLEPSFYYLKIVLTESVFAIFLALLFHSFAYFPFEKKKLVQKTYLFKYFYIFLVFYLAFFYIYTMLGENYEQIPIFQAGYILVTFIYFFTIFKKYNVKKKEKVRYGRAIVWSYYINLISLIINYFLVSVWGEKLGIEPFTHYYATFILIPISYFYTIAKYDLLDSLIKVGKNIQYMIVTSVVNIFSVILFIYLVYFLISLNFYLPNLHFNGNSIEVLDKPLRPELYAIYSKILVLLISGLFLYLIVRFRKVSLEFLNKKYHIVIFDYQLLIEELADSFQNQSSLENLASFILDKFQELIKLKQCGILVYENESSVVFQSYKGVLDNQLTEYIYSKEREIINNIKEFSGNILIDYLDKDIKEVLLSCKFKYVIPLRVKGKVLGLMFLGEKLSESRLKANDLLFSNALANQAAVSLENFLLYSDLAKQERLKQELEIAREIQLSSLPKELPSIKSLDISGISLPALEVGGDYYDIFFNEEMPDTITAIIGDVSGKGTSAALYMSKIQGVVKTLQEFNLNIKDLMIKTNELIFTFLNSGSFITAFCIQFNLKEMKLKMARAGHLPLYHYDSRKKELIAITPKGIALGLNTGELFNRNLEEVEIDIAEGDVFVLVTDGIVEARNSEQKEYEEERLKEIIKLNISKSSHDIKDCIIQDLNSFTGRTSQFDDITILVIKVKNK